MKPLLVGLWVTLAVARVSAADSPTPSPRPKASAPSSPELVAYANTRLTDQKLTQYAALIRETKGWNSSGPEFQAAMKKRGLSSEDTGRLNQLCLAYYTRRNVVATEGPQLAATQKRIVAAQAEGKISGDLGLLLSEPTDMASFRKDFVSVYGEHATVLLENHWPEYEGFFSKPTGNSPK